MGNQGKNMGRFRAILPYDLTIFIEEHTLTYSVPDAASEFEKYRIAQDRLFGSGCDKNSKALLSVTFHT